MRNHIPPVFAALVSPPDCGVSCRRDRVRLLPTKSRAPSGAGIRYILRGSIIAIALAGGMPCAAAQTPMFAVTIRPAAAGIADGQCVQLEVTVTNVAAKAALIGLPPGPAGGAAQGDGMFNISVVDQRGQPAPPTAYVRWAERGIYAGSWVSHTLAPGQSLHTRVGLSKFFDLTVPGTYRIQVSLKQEGPHAAKSNIIEIQIPNVG